MTDASVPVAVAADASEPVAVALEEASALLVWVGRLESPSDVAPEGAAPSLGTLVDADASAEEEPDTPVGSAEFVASVPDGAAAVPVAESELALALSEAVLEGDAESVAEVPAESMAVAPAESVAVAPAESVAVAPAELSVGADAPELDTPHVAPPFSLGDAVAVEPAGSSDDVAVGATTELSEELEVAVMAMASDVVLAASEPSEDDAVAGPLDPSADAEVDPVAAAESVLLASVGSDAELSIVELGEAEPSLDPPTTAVGAGVIVAVMSAKSSEAEGTTEEQSTWWYVS